MASAIHQFRASGLPAGFILTPATGYITGTPNPPPGTFNVTVTASSGSDGHGDSFAEIIENPPVIYSPLTLTSATRQRGQLPNRR